MDMATLNLLAWMPGPMELVVILIIGLLLFGKRLPEIARNMGRGVVEFKRGLRNIEDDVENADQYQPPPPPPPPKKLYNEQADAANEEVQEKEQSEPRPPV